MADHPVEQIIADGSVVTLFQPIVHLASRTVAGFEALTRGPAGTALESPIALFDAAARAGRLAEMDWLCRSAAMDAAADAGLPESLSWLINVEPAGLATECPPHLLPSLERGRTGLRVILEIVERDVECHVLELIRATDQARRDTWGVALDDVGAIEGSLALLPFLRPDVVKLDMSLVRSVPTEKSAAITAAVRSYAERRNAVILAEGIETAEHERLALVFGAEYGQGYYYGRPGPLPASVPVPLHPIMIRQHLTPIDGRTPFTVLAATSDPQRGSASDLRHIREHLELQAAQGSHASVVLAGFKDSAHFTAEVRARFDRLARVNALTVVRGRGIASHDEPSYHLGDLGVGSAMADECTIIVLSPHYAAAFSVRELDEVDSDGVPLSEFVYTYRRESVIDAARCFVQELTDTLPVPLTKAPSSLASVRALPLGESGRHSAADPAPGSCVSSRPATALLPQAVAAPNNFRAASRAVLDYLNTHIPMGFWSITRVQNDRQTYLFLDENVYGLAVGGSHSWEDSFCVHMVAGTGPRVAPDTRAVPAYATAPVNDALQIGAYSGAPIVDADGSVFGAICGLDRAPREDLVRFGPMLDTLSELLSLALAGDRAVHAAQSESRDAQTKATTDALTGVRNRAAWNEAIARLDHEYATYADPTVIAVIDLDGLKRVNDGVGGHGAGDQLLRDAATILRRHMRPADVLARLGGDEFGVILADAPAALAPRRLRGLNRALDHAGVPASVGWAVMQSDRFAASVVHQADQAMLDAKRRRRTTRSEVGAPVAGAWSGLASANH